MRDSNIEYDRNAAKVYAEKYALAANTKEYPYFTEDDCANFVSQSLRAGGIKFIGYRWDNFNSWFCNSVKPKELKKISITWRAARYFARHWGNEKGMGRNRAYKFLVYTVEEAIIKFIFICNFLDIGDVVQYGNPIPHHTQIIHDKSFNSKIGMNDLFMAQHTENRLYVSFYEYLNKIENKNKKYVYIYKISGYR